MSRFKKLGPERLERYTGRDLRDESGRLEGEIRRLRAIRVQIARELDRRAAQEGEGGQVVCPAFVPSEAVVEPRRWWRNR